jgi:ParB family chromosome partitioning protein
MAAKKKSTTPRAPARRKTPKKQEARSAGLEATDVRLDAPPKELAERVELEGGSIIGAYRDPLGGHPLVLAVLPIDKIEPTPFQRDLSDAHHKRLSEVISKTGRFLDPLIAITAPNGGFWTPNGRHRLEAMRRLGAKAITVLLVPDREVAWQILALNTEKAHNLKEKSLEVVRIYRGLIATEEDASKAESGFSFYLEDPALVTLGVCYEKNPRFAGGAYHSVLRRVEKFVDLPIEKAIAQHEHFAEMTLEIEAQVVKAIEKLKAKGFQSPYLRSFVVSRINPLRWIQGEIPPAEKVLETMRERAAKFNVEKVKQEDIARSGGVPDEE